MREKNELKIKGFNPFVKSHIMAILPTHMLSPLAQSLIFESRAMTAEMVFNQFINTKWGARQLLKDGVIKQPEWFVVFKRDERSSKLSRNVIDRAYRRKFTDTAYVRDFRKISQEIVSGKWHCLLSTNLIAMRKDEGYSLFNNWYRQVKGNNLAITFVHASDPYQEPVKNYFARQGIMPSIPKGENVMRLPLTHPGQMLQMYYMVYGEQFPSITMYTIRVEWNHLLQPINTRMKEVTKAVLYSGGISRLDTSWRHQMILINKALASTNTYWEFNLVFQF